jgi:hypothetical protein
MWKPGGGRRPDGVGGRDPAAELGGSVTVCRARQEAGGACPPGNGHATCRHSTLPTQASGSTHRSRETQSDQHSNSLARPVKTDDQLKAALAGDLPTFRAAIDSELPHLNTHAGT